MFLEFVPAIRSDNTAALETLHGGQFTSSTQWIKTNFLVIPALKQHRSYFSLSISYPESVSVDQSSN